MEKAIVRAKGPRTSQPRAERTELSEMPSAGSPQGSAGERWQSASVALGFDRIVCQPRRGETSAEATLCCFAPLRLGPLGWRTWGDARGLALPQAGLLKAFGLTRDRQ